MSDKLNTLKEKVEAIILDLATLEVASFTGSEIELSNQPAGNAGDAGGDAGDAGDAGGDAAGEAGGNAGNATDNNNEIDHKKVFEIIRSRLTTSTLVGYSRFEMDGDAMNYTNSDLGEPKKYLLDAHNSMVEGAQKSRKDFFDFVLKVIK